MVGIARRTDESPDERYRRLIEQSGVGLFQTRVDGRIDWLNRAAARLFGYADPAEFMAAVSDVRDVYVDPTRRESSCSRDCLGWMQPSPDWASTSRRP